MSSPDKSPAPSKKSGFGKLSRRLSFSPKSGEVKKRRPAPVKGSGLSHSSASVGRAPETQDIEVKEETGGEKEEKSTTFKQSQSKPELPVSNRPPLSRNSSTPTGSLARGPSRRPGVKSIAPQGKGWKGLVGFATAIQNFEPQGKYQVQLQLGDKVKLQEQNLHWYKGIVLSTRKKGIFPKNFVHVTKKLYENDDDAMKELQTALWEWVGLLKTYFLENRTEDFCNMQARVIQLMDWYAKIKSPETDEGLKLQLMSRVFEKIEEGKRKMGLDVIVRRPDGTRCTELNTGIIDLYRQYDNLAKPLQKEKKKKEKDPNTLIYLELKLFACSVGEPTEIFFTVWNRRTNLFISENFYAQLTAQGMPREESRIGNIKTIFKDIYTDELEAGDLYLFVKLIRIGKLEKKGKTEYRIPYGGALIALNDLNHKEKEYTLPIYTSNLESNFYNLPELILKKKDVSLVAKAKGIIIGLNRFYGTLETCEFPKTISDHLRVIQITDKYGFPEVVMPGSSRNDFYLTFEAGEFSADKTFEIEASVRMDDMQDYLPDCMMMGTSEGMFTSFRSSILYHSSTPKWNERLSLLIPPSVYEKCHIFFTVRVCSANSAKEYAYGYLRLNKEDGTVINDGPKQIQLFRLPKANDDPLLYFNDPSKLLLRKGEFIHVKSLLCSTALTQNSFVHSLLKWKCNVNKLPEILNHFTFGSQFEIIKFMQETFDSMCQILDSNLEGVNRLVYDAIVFVIGILVDEKTSRFTNFAPVLEAYLTKHFSSRTAHHVILECLHEYLNKAEKEAKNVLASLKAFTYLLKIIKRSISISKEESEYNFALDEELHGKLEKLFAGFAALMSKTSPGLIGAQAALLKNMSYWFKELETIFTLPQLAQIIASMVAADKRKGSEAKGKINVGKIELLSTIIEHHIFKNEESRKILVPLLFENITRFIKSSELSEVRACIIALSKILHFMHNDRDAARGLLGRVLSVLPDITLSFEVIVNQEETYLLAVTCLLNIYFIISPASFTKFIERMPPNLATSFLTQQCELMFVWCRGKTYPDNWFSMKMFQMAMVRKLLLGVSETIKATTSHPAASWNAETRGLWLSFFQAGFAFLDSTVLRLESFSAAKQALIRETYGDMRLGLCTLLNKQWTALGENQNLLSNELVKEFLLVSMIGQRDLRNFGINLYFSALEREFRSSRNFRAIESQTIDAFSASLSPGASSSLHSVNFNEYFFQALQNKLTRTPDIATEAAKFLGDLKELCQHLVALSTLRDGDHDDDKTIATLRLMEYLLQSQRINAYVRYIHSLVDQKTKAKRYSKAGMILLLHCKLLVWEDIPVTSRAPGGKRNETQFELKDRLYVQTIDLLEQGTFYEKAIELTQELSIQVKQKLCDYPRAAILLQKEASLYNSMLQENRYPCEYFRVAYYGGGFASNLRNKEFIYCGNPLERIGEFTERIQSKFPNSELMKTTDKPPPEILDSDGMFIQLFMVKPFPSDMNLPYKSHPNLPGPLKEYRCSMIHVDRFLYKRPFSKDKAVRKENEFKDLWTMDIFYSTKEHFPVITDRSEVTHVETKEVTPVENAVQTIKSKNVELNKLANQYENCTGNASPFTMVLSGTIDAAVSGGVENYKKAFLVPEYVKENPNHKCFVDDLCNAFTRQLEVLSSCIVVHAGICPESMQQLQDHLEEKLKELQETWSGDQKKQEQDELDQSYAERPQSAMVVEEGGWGRAPADKPERVVSSLSSSNRRRTIIGNRVDTPPRNVPP